ncbi:hypothetical protein SCLCIDRAFT_1212939 [Scleroderma citrinum Foug A]|uniref:Uncharacterized protein n=1 Tax=Scleroderma citrinum Foug A TaxID=1036808 RepID=A0A0C3AIX7_9AGAM|nr:hypothetical protein SCLCIDRAFT_1212939 [Scleroderma citrinum Foug A]
MKVRGLRQMVVNIRLTVSSPADEPGLRPPKLTVLHSFLDNLLFEWCVEHVKVLRSH